jgi:hypothetical protein
MQHPLLKPNTCEVDYESIFKWSEGSRIADLIKRVQQ